MNYYRKEGESDLDYIIRLTQGKVDGTYDIDYVEMFKLAFDVDYASDNCRKMFYCLKLLLPYLKDNKTVKIKDDDVLKQLEQMKLDIEKEKVKLRDQRREYTKLLTVDARFDHLVDHVKDGIQDIIKQKPLEINSKPSGVNVSSNNEGVLLCSDWHSELEVDNFLNKFNQDIFRERVAKLISKTIEYGKFHNISTLHVFDLGDLISGIIHTTTRVANNELTVTQTMSVAEILSEMLVQFANNFDNVKLYTVLDNHSRVFANKHESVVGESFARFIPWYLKSRIVECGNVEIVDNSYDEEINVATVCGKNVFAVHGHKDKLNTIVSDLSMMLKIIPDYIFVAHWHHNIEDEVHSCDIVANQSLIGVDSYSKDIRKTSKPAQKFMVFSKGVGRLCTYSISLK